MIKNNVCKCDLGLFSDPQDKRIIKLWVEHINWGLAPGNSHTTDNCLRRAVPGLIWQVAQEMKGTK